MTTQTRSLTFLGRLTAAEPDRTLKGTLLPFGVPGYTSAGRVVARAGSVLVPDDLSALAASLDHFDGRDLVADFQDVVETPAGLVASWKVRPTHGGDKLLAEFRSGKRTGISVELEPYTVRDGQLADSMLVGCAFPLAPAFDTARLAAALVPDTTDDDDDPNDDPDDDQDDEQEPAEAEDPEQQHTEADPAEDDGAEDGDDTHQEGTTVSTATAARAPRDLRRPRKAGDTLTAENATKTDAFRLFAQYAQTRSPRLLAALSDITGDVMSEAAVPQWLGELWSGNSYQRRIVPLIGQDTLTSFTINGWRWVTPPAMDEYAGNKAAVPSNAVDIELATEPAIRLAGAHDIDRKFRDFGDDAFFASYFNAMTQSYAKLTDQFAVNQLKLSATDVVPGSVPAGANKTTMALIDLALSIIDIGTPTFALVEKSAYRDLFTISANNALAALELGLGLDEGSMAGFKIIPVAATAQTAGPGNRWPGLDTGEILVGTRSAATFYELGGGAPIRVEAQNIANGGIDEGLFGYCGAFVHDPRGLAIATLTAGP